MSAFRTLLCLVAALAAGCVLPARAGAGWVRPVTGRVVAGFAYQRAHPFAGAQRRGIDLAAASGAPVRAPCPGRVAYAGPVPRAGAVVTVRCGAVVATVLRLGAVAVRRGDAVFAGQSLGRAGPGGRVHLGARRAADRFGYVDPAALLGGGRRPPAPAVPARPRLGPPPGVARPLRTPRPLTPAAVRARPASAAPPSSAPLAAWVGVALAACALTAGGAGRARRRRVACAAPCRSTSPRRSTT